MIKAAIAGGTGYTAGELIRLLINHPKVEIVAVLSSSMAGEFVSSVHRDLIGETTLKFVSNLEGSNLKIEPDVLFLTLGHGLSRPYLKEIGLSTDCKIVDLGNDFRLDPIYNQERFIYGLCELNRTALIEANYVANPGCFATSILLALLPLAAMGQINDQIHIHAITGSTGAGKNNTDTNNFSYRDSNISVYKPFTHQHLGEITKVLSQVPGALELPQVNFIPVRGDFTRGIFTSLYTKMGGNCSLEGVVNFYKEYYIDSPFVKISDFDPSLKEVVNTNKALLHIESHNGYWYVTSVIDNLLKGASGQAIQNMNLMFGLNETCGLKLKGSAF
ncbi:MAG: N-acetyl-gamma-glutamyl-phosphate reductase [Bacteroidales bacterium]